MKVCPACRREYGDDASVCVVDAVSLVVLDTSAGGTAQDLVGQVVDGRYRLERIVGRGGMGTVYACRHVVVGKEFAIKVLRSGVERSDEMLQRFVREAQAANAVRSRHICEMLDFGQLPNGALYVVMELLDGMSLTRALRDQNLDRRQLKHVFVQIADTLQKAHDQGIVHRDLKPDNVVLVRDEGDPLFVKLVDFGIAKMMQKDASDLTETGVILGTPYYMSPEQARGDAVDHRSDVYALGVMMFRAFTGKLPFVADTAMGVLTRHLTEKPPLPSQVAEMDGTTERLILRCLEKRPIDRFQSMADVAAALRSIPDEWTGRASLAHAATAAPRERQATPTRVDGPSARPFEDSLPSVPDPRASFTSVPPFVGSTSGSHPLYSASPPSAASHPGVATYAGTASGSHPIFAMSQAPASFGQGGKPFTGTASGSHPLLAASQPIVTAPSGIATYAGTASGSHPLLAASQPGAALEVGRSEPSGYTGVHDSPKTDPIPAQLAGEANTHRGVVSSRMAAKGREPRGRGALFAGGLTITLIGAALGIVALRSPTAEPSTGAQPSSSAPLEPGRSTPDTQDPVSALAPSTAEQHEDTKPPAPPPTASASSVARGAPTNHANSPPRNSPSALPATTGAPPAAPPRGDEIRSPFD